MISIILLYKYVISLNFIKLVIKECLLGFTLEGDPETPPKRGQAQKNHRNKTKNHLQGAVFIHRKE